MSEVSNEDVVDMIKQGISLSGRDLSGINLFDGDLVQPVFKMDKLFELDLSGANFSNANLKHSKFGQINLIGADFSNSDLFEAEFDSADLSDANFNNSNLTKSKFFASRIVNAKFINVILQETQIHGCILSGCNMQGSNLIYASIYADLNDTDFSGSNIFRIDLEHYNNEEAILSADFIHAPSGIKCTHIYVCDILNWNDPKQREKYRKNLAPGEFNELCTPTKSKSIIRLNKIAKDKDLLNNLKEIKILNEEYITHISNMSGFGTDHYSIQETTLKEKYLSNKELYDIFIYKKVVYKKNKKDDKEKLVSIELDSNVLNLLILFLKYKDEHLLYHKLYDKSWEKSIWIEAYKVFPPELMNRLKTAVSTVRRIFKDIVGFNIPHSREGGYICKGNFNFCVILTKSVDAWYTLEED